MEQGVAKPLGGGGVWFKTPATQAGRRDATLALTRTCQQVSFSWSFAMSKTGFIHIKVSRILSQSSQSGPGDSR